MRGSKGGGASCYSARGGSRRKRGGVNAVPAGKGDAGGLVNALALPEVAEEPAVAVVGAGQGECRRGSGPADVFAAHMRSVLRRSLVA